MNTPRLKAAFELLRRLPNFFLRVLLLPLAHGLYSIRVVGRENVPLEGPVLLVSNHVSFIDAMLIAMANRRLTRFLMLRAYYDLPVAGWFFRATGCIPVSSGDGPKALAESFRRARAYMLSGQAVCIFAEGEISRHGQMQRFKKGFERMVEGSDAPVVPVHLDEVWGSLFSFSEGRLLFKRPRRLPYRVTVSFGAPLPATATAFEVRQAILALGASAFRHRLADAPPLPLAFARTAKRRPFAPCLADSTGASLNALSALTGAHLLGRVLEPLVGEGERVAVMLPPSVGGALANVALALRGKVLINLNYTASKDIIDACLAKAEAATVVTSRLFVEKLGWKPSGRMVYIEDAAPAIGSVSKTLTAALFLLTPSFILERTAFSKARGPLERLATIMFTSGSTGAPKGVMLTHANVLANLEAVAQVISIGPEDRMLGVLPFFHSFGFTATLWLPLRLGMGAVYHFNPLDARTIGRLVSQTRATALLGTPTFLLAYLRRVEAEEFKTLRYVVVGAEKLREDVAKAFIEKYGVIPLEGYGATALSPIAALNIPDIAWPGIKQTGPKLGTVGLPLPGVFMKVVDPQTGRELGADQPGLLLVKGPNVMKGYLGDEAGTREVIKDGYYVTGDIAKIDEDGFVTLTDRLSCFSKVGGEMVAHIKIEESLQDALGARLKRRKDGAVEVREQVQDVLDADGETDEAVGKARLEALLSRDGAVGHRGGMTDERLDAAQALGQGEDLAGGDHALGALEVALEFEGDHPAEAGHLRPGGLVAGVAGQAGVVDLRNLGMAEQMLRHDHGVLAVPPHAQSQGLGPAQHQETVQGSGHGAHGVLQELVFLVERLVAGEDGAAHDVRMPA